MIKQGYFAKEKAAVEISQIANTSKSASVPASPAKSVGIAPADIPLLAVSSDTVEENPVATAAE